MPLPPIKPACKKATKKVIECVVATLVWLVTKECIF